MTVEWTLTDDLVDYPTALDHMEKRVAAIKAGTSGEQVWLLQHPPLYTAGTSSKPSDLVDPERFPVYDAGRGGQYTYHGPGQRVGYLMLDLTKRGRDIRRYIWLVEEVMIRSLADLGVIAERKAGRVGVWVTHGDGREEKIAAIGVRVRSWITFHGFAINAFPDLSHFEGIVPCGIAEHGVTSLKALGRPYSFEVLDARLMHHFEALFGNEPKPMPAIEEYLASIVTEKKVSDPIMAAHDSFV